jgi:DNA-binding NtrC family response regulator
VSEDAGLKQVRNEAEKQLFLQVWQQSNENVHETARRLGIKRENVYYLMDKFGVMRADS